MFGHVSILSHVPVCATHFTLDYIVKINALLLAVGKICKYKNQDLT